VALRIEKILHPTDFSELSLHALRYGREFAEQFQAQLHCLHVVDESQQYWTAMGPEATPIGPAMDEVVAAAEEHLRVFADTHLADLKPPPETKLVVGKPFLEIIRYAREADCDLIVLATHGHTGLMHALMGSTAEKVVRKAPCPVLTVRSGEHEFVLP
jgi:nucleotide-binding universal stress UspA family protein